MLAAADAFAERGLPRHDHPRHRLAGRALPRRGLRALRLQGGAALRAEPPRATPGARDLLVAAAEPRRDPTEALRGDHRRRSPRWHAEHYEVGRDRAVRVPPPQPRAPRRRARAAQGDRRASSPGCCATGVATGEFEVDDVPGTALALLSMAIDVARWYAPDVRRTPADDRGVLRRPGRAARARHRLSRVAPRRPPERGSRRTAAVTLTRPRRPHPARGAHPGRAAATRSRWTPRPACVDGRAGPTTHPQPRRMPSAPVDEAPVPAPVVPDARRRTDPVRGLRSSAPWRLFAVAVPRAPAASSSGRSPSLALDRR